MTTNNSWNTPYLTSDGQLLIGSATGRPVASFLTSTGQTLTVSSGHGSINIDVSLGLNVPYG